MQRVRTRQLDSEAQIEYRTVSKTTQEPSLDLRTGQPRERSLSGQPRERSLSGQPRKRRRWGQPRVRGVGELIKVSVISLASGILGAALLPFFGPVAAIGISLGVGAAVIEIQENLKPLDVGLQDDTIRKLVEPLQGKQPDERDLRRVIEDVLSKDRQANEDLAKAFFKLQPTIQEVARSTKVPESANINIEGDVYGLVTGDYNKVTQTFEGFLHEK